MSARQITLALLKPDLVMHRHRFLNVLNILHRNNFTGLLPSREVAVEPRHGTQSGHLGFMTRDPQEQEQQRQPLLSHSLQMHFHTCVRAFSITHI